jgi:hypothetical protein
MRSAVVALLAVTEERYVEALADAARECIAYRSNVRDFHFDHRSRALRYLASLRHPIAVRLLDEALDSANPVAVEYAVVNLLFDGAPEAAAARAKARALLLRELVGKPGALALDLKLWLSVSLGDAEVESTARRRNPGGVFGWYWRRRRWSVYNWLDDRVVEPNEVLVVRAPSPR